MKDDLLTKLDLKILKILFDQKPLEKKYLKPVKKKDKKVSTKTSTTTSGLRKQIDCDMQYLKKRLKWLRENEFIVSKKTVYSLTEDGKNLAFRIFADGEPARIMSQRQEQIWRKTIEGKSDESISKELNMSESNIRKIWHRMKKDKN